MKMIRDAFGITQEELASYFEITRSQLSVTETGDRILPVRGLTKCIPLLQIIQTNPTPTVEENENQQIENQKKITEQLENCNYQLIIAKKKLANMQIVYRQCYLSLIAANTLLPKLPQDNSSKKDKIWLEILSSKANRKLSTCNMTMQQLQQLEIDTLQFKIDKLKEMMGE